MLFVRNKSSVFDVVERGPPSPTPGRVLTAVRVGSSTICVSECALMMSMKLSCSWHLFVQGMVGSRSMSGSGGSKGERTVQSMSGRLKSPEIQRSLSGEIQDRESANLVR